MASSSLIATDIPELTPRFERYRLTYPSGTVVMAFYAGGAPLEEICVAHHLAEVSAVEDSLKDTR